MWGLDLHGSGLGGDAMSDILAAQAAGASAILVQTGRGPAQLQLLRQQNIDHFQVVSDLPEAVHRILHLHSSS
jgi:phosphoglycolate phosphatase-like HAD superfamily hydrolase